MRDFLISRNDFFITALSHPVEDMPVAGMVREAEQSARFGPVPLSKLDVEGGTLMRPIQTLLTRWVPLCRRKPTARCQTIYSHNIRVRSANMKYIPYLSASSSSPLPTLNTPHPKPSAKEYKSRPQHYCRYPQTSPYQPGPTRRPSGGSSCSGSGRSPCSCRGWGC